MTAVVLAVAATGAVLVYRNGWISAGENWSSVPEIMQSRIEGRLATVAVESGRSADATVVATGYLESRRQAKIGAKVPGRMAIMNVEEGSRVEAGEVLAVLEHADLEASLAAVEASLARQGCPGRAGDYHSSNPPRIRAFGAVVEIQTTCGIEL